VIPVQVIFGNEGTDYTFCDSSTIYLCIEMKEQTTLFVIPVKLSLEMKEQSTLFAIPVQVIFGNEGTDITIFLRF